MGNEADTTPALSLYATIWLTLISGAILMYAAGSQWRWLKRTFEMRNPLILPERMPDWLSGLTFFLTMTFFLLCLTVGIKLIDSYVTEPILQAQVTLAAFVLVGSIMSKFLATSDDAMYLRKPVYWVSLSCSLTVTVVLIIAMFIWCPSHLSEKWWMPCF